jgi:hypothetical protein
MHHRSPGLIRLILKDIEVLTLDPPKAENGFLRACDISVASPQDSSKKQLDSILSLAGPAETVCP